MLNDLAITITLNQVSKYEQDLNRIRSVTQQAGQAAGSAFNSLKSSLSDISNQVPGLGTAISLLSNPITLVAAGVVALGKGFSDAVQTGRTFERALADVNAIVSAGLDTEQTQANLADLRREAERLGSSTEFSASQVASAQEFLARAGVSLADQLVQNQRGVSALESTLSLATVGNLELGRSADIATNILGQFQLQAEQLPSVVDVIAKTTTTANTNIVQLSEAFKFLGPTANALNVDLVETAAVVGVLGNAGIQGSLAGRALGTSLTRLADPVEKARDALAQYNIQAFDLNGNFVGIAPLLGQLEKGFEGVSDQQRQAALSAIFGAEALQEINILLAEGEKGLADYTKVLQGASDQQGALSEQIRQTKLDNLDGAIIQLSSAFEGFQIAISSAFLPVLTEIVLSAANLVRGLTNIGTVANQVGSFLINIFSDPAFQTGIALAVAGLISFNTQLIIASAQLLLIGARLAIGAIISGVATAFSFLATVIGTVTTAVRFLGVAFATNPIGFIITAVGLLITGLVLLAQRFVAVRAVLNGFGAAVVAVANGLKDRLLSVLGGIGEIIVGIFTLDKDKILSGFSSVLDAPSFSEIGRNAAQGFSDAYNQTFQDEAVKNAQEFAQSQQDALNENPVKPNVETPTIPAVTLSTLKADLKTLQTELDNIPITNTVLIREKQGEIAAIQAKINAITGKDVKIGANASEVDAAVDSVNALNKAVSDLEKLALNISTNDNASLENIFTRQFEAARNAREGTERYNEALQEFTRLNTASVDGFSNGFQAPTDGIAPDIAALASDTSAIVPITIEPVFNSTSFLQDFSTFFDLTDEQLKNLQKGFDDLGAKITETIQVGAVNAFAELGEGIGQALAGTNSFRDAFTAALQNILDVILVQVPKLVGVFLLQTGVGLGFPAGIPFILAGIGLTAFSGLASGLLSSAFGDGSDAIGSQSVDSSPITPASSAASASGLGAFNGDTGATIVNEISINIETDGIVDAIDQQRIINNVGTNGN